MVTLVGNQLARDTIRRYELYTDGEGRGRDELQARVKVHAIVTSYEVAMSEASELRKLQVESLVVDEGHRLKNSSSRSDPSPSYKFWQRLFSSLPWWERCVPFPFETLFWYGHSPSGKDSKDLRKWSEMEDQLSMMLYERMNNDPRAPETALMLWHSDLPAQCVCLTIRVLSVFVRSFSYE